MEKVRKAWRFEAEGAQQTSSCFGVLMTWSSPRMTMFMPIVENSRQLLRRSCRWAFRRAS